ncbi:MAG: VOC family protein [Melioribacteraceae bacterium]|nr:VOC family protein [Melioribacteraceae bacterium]
MKGIVILIFVLSSFLIAQEKESEFTRGIIEIGVVVSDLDKSVEFYKNVIGMQKVGGFNIDEDFGKRSGLTGGTPFTVVTMKLIDDDNSTQWKLMSFGKKANHPLPKYIQDDTGMQYTTIIVKTMEPFLKRIKENNITLLGETPTKVGENGVFVLIQDPDGNFIELIQR